MNIETKQTREINHLSIITALTISPNDEAVVTGDETGKIHH